MPVCSFCQTCLAKAGQLHDHYPAFPEFVASGESCHVCRILLESLSEKPRGDIMDRVRSGSYSKATVRISGEDAKVEVITKDRYIKGVDVTVQGPKCKFRRCVHP
jgi:hypothetical protein